MLLYNESLKLSIKLNKYATNIFKMFINKWNNFNKLTHRLTEPESKNFAASNKTKLINYHKLFTPFRSVHLFVDELTKDGTKNDYMANMATKGQPGRTVGRHEGEGRQVGAGFGNCSAPTSFAKSNYFFFVFSFLVKSSLPNGT